MLGVGSSSRNFFLGLVFAVALHLMLFAIKLAKVDPSNTAEQELNISIVMDAEPPEFESNEVGDKADLEQNAPAEEPAPSVIAASPTVDAKPQISISDQSFKQFLQSETERYLDVNPSSVEEFADTFEPYYKIPTAEPEIKYQDSVGQLGGGNYRAAKNGKVVCVLRHVPQTFDDFTNAYASVGAAMDCTPKQAFDLNLRENTL